MISTISSILALPCIMPYISSNSFTLLVVAMIINSAISFIISSSEYISNKKEIGPEIIGSRKYLDINWLLKVRDKGYEKLTKYYSKAYNIDLSKNDEENLKISLTNFINLEKEREILISKIQEKNRNIENLTDEFTKLQAFLEIEYSNLDSNSIFKQKIDELIENKTKKLGGQNGK